MFEFWDFGRIASRPGVNDHELLGKGPGQGQIPGFPGHGSKIPDLTIES
jgi:hypothetical protein